MISDRSVKDHSRRSGNGAGPVATETPEPPAGARVATSERRVGMLDVDAVQIHFTRYVDWMARGYEQFFDELGHPIADEIAAGYAQPVASVHCDYMRPVGLGGKVLQLTWLEHIGRTSFTFRSTFQDLSSDTLLVVARATHVWIRLLPEQVPVPVPAWLREAAGPAAAR